jgi:hypothetical protein
MPKCKNYLHLKDKSRLKVAKCISSLEGQKRFLIEEWHNKCQKSIPKKYIELQTCLLIFTIKPLMSSND